MNQLDFKGRHAVITGGATGLGYGIAQRLLASGGSVTLWDRDGDAAARAAGTLGSGARAVVVAHLRAERSGGAFGRSHSTALVLALALSARIR